MKMMKRIAAWILLAFTLSGAVACSGTGGEEAVTTAAAAAVTTAAQTEEATTEDALPVKRFDNEEFVILTNARSDDYKSREFACDAPNGITLNDAVYARNSRIEELYGITIKPLAKSGEADVLRNSVQVSDALYDLALLKLESAGPLGIEGFLADFNQMPYLTLDGAWWDVNSVRDLSIGHRLFMTVGDMNICDKDMTWSLFFDKTVAENKKIPDLFELATDKKWTFEKFQELCRDVTNDVNGDGVLDGSDEWGHVTVFARSAIAYMYSMETYFITKDGDDLPVVQLDEQFGTAYDKVISFFSANNMCLDVQALNKGEYANQWRKSEAMFMNQQVLFYAEAMQNAERFRNSENDFGILPLPSAEEGKYGHNFVWKEAYITVVPADITVNADRADRDALLTEAIQRASHDTVLPAYYEIALKSRFARDAQSSVMIDIIFANRYYDIASYYGWGNLSETIQNLGRSLVQSYTSTLKAIEKVANNDIRKTVDAVSALK